MIPVAVVAVMGLVLGLVLAVASKRLAVPVDEKFYDIRSLLPGVNCGVCGCAGCDEYAKKVLDGEIATNICMPGGSDVALGLSELLGTEALDIIPSKAVVKCNGGLESTGRVMDYVGPRTCEASNALYQGRGKCSYGCMGYGDCTATCPENAIQIEDGIAVINRKYCIGCGLCVSICPKKLILLTPEASRTYVSCSSLDKGGVTRKICSKGCIGCKRCEKVCAYGAVEVIGNVAVIHPEKCVNCRKCREVCPTDSIRDYPIVTWEPKEA